MAKSTLAPDCDSRSPFSTEEGQRGARGEGGGKKEKTPSLDSSTWVLPFQRGEQGASGVGIFERCLSIIIPGTPLFHSGVRTTQISGSRGCDLSGWGHVFMAGGNRLTQIFLVFCGVYSDFK